MKSIPRNAAISLTAAALGLWGSVASAGECEVDTDNGKTFFYLVTTDPATGDCYDKGVGNVEQSGGWEINDTVDLTDALLQVPTGYQAYGSVQGNSGSDGALTLNGDGSFSISGLTQLPWILVLKQGSTWAAFALGSGVYEGTFGTCNYGPQTTSCTPSSALSHALLFGGDEFREVPIPAAAWLLGSGLLGLFAVGRRRKVVQVAAA